MKMAALFACFLGNERRSSRGRSEQTRDNLTNIKDGSEIVYVELLRHSGQPLGLELEGGTDHDVPVQVAILRPGCVADMSGALQIGDRILSINGTVTERLTHSEAVALLENAGNVVNLEIAFDALPEGSQKLDDGMELKTAFITVPCGENTIFPGFVISGGRLENRPITVSHVKQGSFAYKKGILRAGDRILQVNGIDMRNASRNDADQLLVHSEGNCTLQIEYDVPVHEGLDETNGPLIVELQKPHGASLGITLSDDRVSGEPIVISKVREAGIADRSGALHVGDRLLSINGQQLDQRPVQEARRLLAHSDISVKLEIMAAHNFSEQPGISPVDDAQSDISSRASQSTSFAGSENLRRPSQLSLTSITPSTQILCHPEIMTIKLKADEIGFGMGIQGGASEYGNYPIVISELIPDGPAGLLGQLLVGDRILSINGVGLEGATIDQAYKLIQESDDTMTLNVEFDVTDASVIPTSGTFEVTLVKAGFLNLGLSIRSSGDKIWISGLKKGGIASRAGSIQAGDILLAINGQSLYNASPYDAASLLTNSEDIISLNIKRESLNNFMPSKASQHKSNQVIYSVELFRNGQNLGISLDGSDVPGQPIIISEIKEGGVAHRTGAIKVGDRIIAINGESLLTKNIEDAFRILKSAGDTVTLKISKGVVSRRGLGRPRTRTSGNSSNRYYRHNRYGSRFNRPGIHNSRFPSTISQTSESERSNSVTSFNDSLPYIASHRYSRPEPILRNNRYTPIDYTNSILPGRHSPNRPRHSPSGNGRGRSSPSRVSPHRDRLGSAKVRGMPSGLPTTDLTDMRRGSLTETTDEETVYDEDLSRHRRYPPNIRNGHQSSLSYYGTETPLSDSGQMFMGTYPRKNPTSQNSMKEKKKLETMGKRSPNTQDTLNTQTTNSVLEESILDTLLKSEDFVHRLRKLATQSGSSAEDSDPEPSMKLPPHFQKKLLDHVHSIMSPVQMHLVEVTVERSSENEGFGFSLSDGFVEPGVYVNEIRPNGPADGSGLEPYDRIIKFNDIIVQDFDCCKIYPLFSEAGNSISLTIARNPLAVNNGAAARSSPLPIQSGEEPS